MNQETRKIEGTAVVFNQRSEDLGGFTEIVEPSALDGVDISDVVLLYNHQTGDVLARTSANTLNLSIDNTGVNFEADIPTTTLGNDTMTNLNNGNVRGMSFGFTIDDDDWKQDAKGITHIVRKIGRLFELSLTPFPAYKETDVAVSKRSLQLFKEQKQLIDANREWLKLQKDNMEDCYK